MAFSAPNL